jgi:hypothetical protein
VALGWTLGWAIGEVGAGVEVDADMGLESGTWVFPDVVPVKKLSRLKPQPVNKVNANKPNESFLVFITNNPPFLRTVCA